ncbi:hypothetical protein [Paenibacillus sp. GP183]|uniref:hypothetical protein n=1 Tax=Paenibacillus sp. GP183 TaxID=1882751 RepID=UPI0008993750|nr:hypothetical protein [Paenibacillus sp. GP183]SEB43789.1 hypothetical protein SAMN05443246_0325 [Paenibacillus sp. GP183]
MIFIVVEPRRKVILSARMIFILAERGCQVVVLTVSMIQKNDRQPNRTRPNPTIQLEQTNPNKPTRANQPEQPNPNNPTRTNQNEQSNSSKPTRTNQNEQPKTTTQPDQTNPKQPTENVLIANKFTKFWFLLLFISAG